MTAHETTALAGAAQQARYWLIGGRVQGVGFRPFVYRLAVQFGLSGWVRNCAGQVEILAQGNTDALQKFSLLLLQDHPAAALPRLLTSHGAALSHFDRFEIRISDGATVQDNHIPPDSFLCSDCLAEFYDTNNRRFHYPFINCTQCGPRYTLIQHLPYDRSNTAMADFPLCPDCRAEYADPSDRRFHAEPLACPTCGPQLIFSTVDQGSSKGEEALAACIAALGAGLIVAIKGVGGYHLCCDARNDVAVQRLRQRKRRPHKALAVLMMPQAVDEVNALGSVQRRSLAGAARPIVLVTKHAFPDLAPAIAPGLCEIGVMLPDSPLHERLAADFGGPLIMTSGNLSGEPVLTDNAEAEQRLGAVADAFLHHDRAIVHPADDSLFRVIDNQARPLRLGRGHAPLELPLPFRLRRPVLALGGHTKNTVALAWADRVVVSPHVGDLDSPRSRVVFEKNIDALQTLYNCDATILICDAHRDYASSRWAYDDGRTVITVSHHRAHASALAGEYPDIERWLMFTWDGVGLGDDNTLWGGEALLGQPGAWRRAASWRPFRVPGGERAAREPWRSALALCLESGNTWRDAVDPLLVESWKKRVNCPQTTAVGRLFDAAAAMAGVVFDTTFEGQGPMYLEAAATEHHEDEEAIPLPLELTDGLWRSDWAPLVPMLMDPNLSTGQRAARFHASLALAVLEQTRVLHQIHGVEAVGLCGGVFQNRVLVERVTALLREHGFAVKLSRQIPSNDAGLAFGQIIEAAANPANGLQAK